MVLCTQTCIHICLICQKGEIFTRSWYGKQNIGVHTIQKWLPSLTGHLGLERRTNQALRATCATELMDQNIPDPDVRRVTGHKSLQGLYQYKRTTPQMRERISNALALDSGSSEEEPTQQGQKRNREASPPATSECKKLVV